MLKLFFMILGGIIIGAFLLIFIIPFFIFLSFVKLFVKKNSKNVFIWRNGSYPDNNGAFEQEDKNTSENLSDSVYDIECEVVDTSKKTEDRKQIQG